MTTISANEFLKGGTPTIASQAVPTSQPAPTSTPSFGSRVSTDINDAGYKVRQQIKGEGEFAGQSSVQRGVGAAATASGVPLKVGYEALPEFARKGLDYIGEKVKQGFGAVVDKVSDNKSLQNFMVDVPKNNTGEQILGTLGSSGEISGNILAYHGIAKTLDKAFTDPYKSIRGEFKPAGPDGTGGGGNPNTMKMYDHLIETKQVPAETIYSDVTKKIYQPQIATQIVDDAANYLKENGFPKIGEQLKASVDVTNLTPELMTQTAEHILSNPSLVASIAEGTGSVFNKVKGVLPKSKVLGTMDEAAVLAERKASAIKDATPDYESSSFTQKQKLLDNTKEGGVFTGRESASTELQKEAGMEVSKIPEYNPAATKLEKYQVVRQEVTKRAEQLKVDIKTNKTVVVKKEVAAKVNKVINEVKNKSLLIQSIDPAIVNYNRVLKNGLKQVSGDSSGVLELRKILDDIYENARGKQAFGSDKIAALDEVHTAARNELTKILIESVKNVDVKASLRAQWNLYRALDELRVSAAKEGGSSLDRLKQKFPMTTGAVEAVGRATGLGGAVNVLNK